jgi:hypothetical protein
LKKIKLVSVEISDLQRKSTVFETLLTVKKCKLETAHQIFPYRVGDLNPTRQRQRQIGPETSVIEEIKSKTARKECTLVSYSALSDNVNFCYQFKFAGGSWFVE